MNILPLAQPLVISTPDTSQPDTNSGTSFSDVLNNALDNLNNSQLQADQSMQKYLTGDVQDIHQVTISMEEAQLTMQLALAVRNKLLDVYKQISTMQV